MPGNREGGLKARETNLKKNPNFYADIGAEGGRKSRNGGFASEKVGPDGLSGRQRAHVAGSLGGAVSRRGKKIEKN